MVDTIKNKAEQKYASTAKNRGYISIKWKLLAICVFLVTLPSSFLGIMGYAAYKAHIQKNNEILLRKITLDWQEVTNSYIDQLERVLRREEVLVQQRLQSVVQTATTLLAYVEDQRGGELAQAAKVDTVADKLSQLEIGRSGFVFLADGDGNILLAKDRSWKNNRLQHFLVSSEDTTAAQQLAKVRELKDGDSLLVSFATYEQETGRMRQQLASIGYFEPWDMMIGALISLIDFKSYELEAKLQKQLRYRVSEQRIGEYGYIYIINSNGEYIVSYDRMRDGENILHHRDESGRFFIKEIISKARKLGVGETILQYYPWKNISENEHYKKVAAVTYVPEWDWIIGASTYERDYFKGLDRVRMTFIAICILAILLGSSIGYFFAFLIARPIQSLNELSLKAANGQLDVVVDEKTLQQSNEIGGLAGSFQKMTTNLRTLIEEKETINTTLLQKNEELAIAKEELEKAVVMAKQLMQKANQANEAKSIFLANMSHELRTPLNVILGYAQLLAGGKNSCTACRNDSRIILQSGNHLLMLINDILDIAKIEVKRLELMKSEINFQQLLDDVSHMVSLEAERKNIAFIKTFTEDLPIGVRADEKRLKQVLINLLNNAVKFTDAGSVTFAVAKSHEIDDRNGVVAIRFGVLDTGRGIPEHALQSIFKPFEQVKCPDRVRSGTGLGLAICNEIVSQMGGSLDVESSLGKGSRFYFTVLLETVQQENYETDEFVDHGRYEGETQKILIVDDIDSNRMLMRDILEAYKFEAYEAAGGKEALELVAEVHPALLLLDLNMPEMDGYEVIRRLRKRHGSTGPKIVVLSGNVSADDRQRSQHVGADDFLAKPIEINTLLSTLQKQLDLVWSKETVSA